MFRRRASAANRLPSPVHRRLVALTCTFSRIVRQSNRRLARIRAYCIASRCEIGKRTEIVKLGPLFATVLAGALSEVSQCDGGDGGAPPTGAFPVPRLEESIGSLYLGPRPKVCRCVRRVFDGSEHIRLG